MRLSTLLPTAAAPSTSLAALATLLLTSAVQPALAGFDFKVAPDKCPKINIQLTTGSLDGSLSATAFNLTIARLPPQGSFVVPPPFYSTRIALDNSALFFSKSTDKGYFYNQSLGSDYNNQEIRSVLVNATLLDINNQPLKNIFGKQYIKTQLLDPLCRTTGTGNNYPTVSGIPGFIQPSATSTPAPGSAGSSDGSSGNANEDGGDGDGDGGPDVKLIVGLVVGLVGGLIATIIAGVVWWRQRQVKKGKRQADQNPYAADHIGSDAREWKPVD